MWLAPFGCLHYFRSLSAIKWSIFTHLVFRWTRELNPRPRTMAQTASPWRSPLDQGASPVAIMFTATFSSVYVFNNLFTFHYRFGGTEGATFCALTTLCKELETFNAIDVYQVAKLYHNKRPGIWKSPVIRTQLLLWGRPFKRYRIFWIYLLYFGNRWQMADIENLMVLPSFILHIKAGSHALQMSCS